MCRRLATLIPPRRSHQVRYHGVLSSAHHLRDRVLPVPPDDDDSPAPAPASMLARRLDWAALLERVFGADVTTCPRCGDPLRVIAFLTDPDLTTHILDHLGLATVGPPIAPARGSPADEPELAFPDF